MGAIFQKLSARGEKSSTADTGSFSATGRHLRRAQSAISQSIATLESVQGVRLFDRSCSSDVTEKRIVM
ncbi:helix-turn-helix domain-containing protein [Pseudomonas sp. TH31]|uniref:helix-turn-helix domain-containing protein n=1 Tax=Pseudomonas sp. TH31 TaxID=2796396 RepID=UPI00191245BD|nr:LysR family transcriptional regulator [Pseudomonas sp. TH31]